MELEGLIFGILRYLLQTARGGHARPRDFFLCPKKLAPAIQPTVSHKSGLR